MAEDKEFTPRPNLSSSDTIVMVEPQLKGQPMSQSTVTSHEYMPFPYATLEASVHHIGTGAERHRRVPLLIIHVEFFHTR